MGMSVAEVGLEDGWVTLNLLRETLGNHLPMIQHGDCIAKPHDQPDVVLNDEDARTVGSNAQQELTQRVFLGGIHSRGWLVEGEQLWVCGQCTRNFKPALISIGEGFGAVHSHIAQADIIEQRLCAFMNLTLCRLKSPGAQDGSHDPRVQALCAYVPADHDVLECGHVREEPDILESATDARARDIVD
jgi:hypothetical protein